MQKNLVLAIDQGTSSTKCLLLNKAGEIVARGSAPLGETYPHPGWVSQNALEIWESVRLAVRTCLAGQDVQAIAAVGLGIAGYWSLAGYAKRRVKKALQFVFDFEDSAIHSAHQRGLDGIICGHIHCAAIRQVGELTYVNCGDWVDSCTAIVERDDGTLELIAWGSTHLIVEPVIPVPHVEETACVS